MPYGYDDNGNLVTVGDSVYYVYDYENRLTVYMDGNGTTEYAYDGDGNRTGQTVTGSVYGSVYGTYEYIYDINRGLPNLLVEKNGAGNINQYTYAGRVLSRTGPEGQIFYHQDGLGSITLITDTDGEPLNRYEYDAFGSPRSVWETVYNPFLFTGEPYDSNGLIFLRARYYDPATGRFLSKDTYLGTLNDPLSQNLYAYVGNNPVLYVDPSGHSAICQGGSLTKTWASTMWWLPTADLVLPIGDIIYVGGTVVTGAIEYGPMLVLAVDSLIAQASRGKQNVRDSGLSDVPDEEISRLARDKTLTSNERQRYIKEEKARGLRNVKKRK
jgi:RHS repeat-associated protein